MKPYEIASFLHELCDVAQVETLPRFRALAGIDNKLQQGFDPVTEADKQAELAIRAVISERFPDHGILGEEFGAHNETAEYCWVIDPVDGTRAFISGIPVWGTLIGLYHNGQPYAGIMHQPFTGERYWCDGEVSRYQLNDGSVTISTSVNTDLSSSIMMATSPELFSEAELTAFNIVGRNARMVRYGADCYAYCQLASGNVGLVIESGLQTYDVAALIPIIEKAGGVFTNWQGGSAAQGGQVIAAANKALHEKALALLADA